MWFELGRWTKVLDGRAGVFAVLSASLCTSGRERGLDHQTHVQPHEWEELEEKHGQGSYFEYLIPQEKLMGD